MSDAESDGVDRRLLSVATEGRVAVLTLNRPEARNAINPALRAALSLALDDAEADDRIWVTVLTATPPVFCAGADLKSIAAGQERELSDANGFAGVTQRERTKPLIAAVNGAALAGGTEIALACDLIVAGELSSFGIPEVKRSLIAAAGGLYRLPRVLPRNIALECAMTGDPLSARRAEHFGLVNEVCADGDVLDRSLELANRICANGPLAVRQLRRLMLTFPYLPDADGARESRTTMKQILGTEDSSEGLRAFIEKRSPVWQAR